MVEGTINNFPGEEVKIHSNVIQSSGLKKSTTEILRIIKDTQLQHGLRHGDYQRYRGYCTRRIRRLRKALKFPQGDKRHFKKRDVMVANINSKEGDERFIHIPLILAERAWSHAMQLRQEANTEPRKKFHLISKLRKACGYTNQLQVLCNKGNFDAHTKLEAEAYVAWMHGTLHFELSLWKSAAENLKKAQVIYENLAQSLPEDEQGLYLIKVNEITPSLRYCAYNIEDGASIDNLLELRARGLFENFDLLVAQTKIQNTEALQIIEWRRKKFAVRSERVRLFLFSLQELDKSIEKARTDGAKIEIIENILMDCKDAISTVKDEVKQDPRGRVITTTKTTSTIQYLLSYLQYIRLTRTIQRNLYLVSQVKKTLLESKESVRNFEGKRVRPQDLTRLYEIILQNISEMSQIIGFEDDIDHQNEINSLRSSFKAFRCYYIALTLVEMKRWTEAVAMYERSKKYALEALKTKPLQFNLMEELENLIQTIDGCKFSAYAYSVLEADDGADFSTTNRSNKFTKPLFERLSQYKEDQTIHMKNANIYRVIPDMKPISGKSLFFDLALNGIEFPSLDEKSELQNGRKTGISGFVKGFLGWGGN